MKINNNLKKIIFYFFVSALTGCNGLAKARLGVLPQKEQSVNPKETQGIFIATQRPIKQKFSTTHLFVNNYDNNLPANFIKLFEKAVLGRVDKNNAKVFENIFRCMFDFEHNNPNGIFNASSDSIDYITQKMADSIWSAADAVFRVFVKQNAAKLRKFVCKCSYDPDFFKSLMADFEATSNASDAGSSLAINNNTDFMKFSEEVFLTNVDKYIAKFLGYALMLSLGVTGVDLNFDMADCMSSDISDDAMPQMMAGIFMSYVAQPVYEVFLKQQAAKLRKFVCKCSYDPDFINSVTTSLQAISDALYAGAAIAVPVGNYALSRVLGGVRCRRSCLSDATKWTVGAMYNGIPYTAFAMDDIKNIINCIFLQYACNLIEF